MEGNLTIPPTPHLVSKRKVLVIFGDTLSLLPPPGESLSHGLGNTLRSAFGHSPPPPSSGFILPVFGSSTCSECAELLNDVHKPSYPSFSLVDPPQRNPYWAIFWANSCSTLVCRLECWLTTTVTRSVIRSRFVNSFDLLAKTFFVFERYLISLSFSLSKRFFDREVDEYYAHAMQNLTQRRFPHSCCVCADIDTVIACRIIWSTVANTPWCARYLA